MDATEREERLLTMVNALAQEAMELPGPERAAFIRGRIVEVADTLAQASASNPEAIALIREFADQLQQWTTAQVRLLEQSRKADKRGSGFLKSLVRRGLKGVKLVISDAHEGLKHAIAKVMGATWQRCRVHWVRNALAHVPKGQHIVVAAAIRQAFLQPDRESASQSWRHVADQLRPRWPKLGTLMDESETDVLAYMSFPAAHRTKLHSVNPLERLNKEVKRRADVVGIFPNEAAILRLIGAVLLEQNDEWQLQARYMQVEAMTEFTLIDPTAEIAALPAKAA